MTLWWQNRLDQVDSKDIPLPKGLRLALRLPPDKNGAAHGDAHRGL